MKLHLGCGQKHLKDYINIDFPISEHNIQEKSVAEIQTDITKLSYPPSTIDEIRLNHVFEHFTRPIACALIVVWRHWLKPDGILHIEVPDFYKTSFLILNPFSSSRKKSVALRHLFGSHEASWAVHREGYTISKLCTILKITGFEILKIYRNSYKGTYNFEIIARKSGNNFSKADLEKNVKDFLSEYLIDFSKSELKLLSVWIDKYRHQLDKGGIK